MKDDIKLPPQPDNDAIEEAVYAHARIFISPAAYDAIRHMMQEYSIDAIEPYKKRIAELEAKLEAVLKAVEEYGMATDLNTYDIELPAHFRSGNSVPVERAWITRKRMEEILINAIKADRRRMLAAVPKYRHWKSLLR